MNIDEFEDYQVDEASTKSNTDSSSRSLEPVEPVIRPVARQVIFPMPNTRSAILNNFHFSSVLRELRPDIFIGKQEVKKEKDFAKKEQKQNTSQARSIQENLNPNLPNIFSGQNNQLHSAFNVTRIIGNQNRSLQGAIGWVTPQRNFRAFDIRSNPFHFCSSIEQEGGDPK